ncbi:hypothetical protein MKEN_00189700 [Mycena kentingensis (nom. inval.)]|nr:hypothetical protein MKEN_00189700 [Mycena kentingensis (nom. inval.)]
MPAGNLVHTPHYAVIFTSKRCPTAGTGTPRWPQRWMGWRERSQGIWAWTMLLMRNSLSPCFLRWLRLSLESADGDLIYSVTISYWADEENIRAWKRNVDHLLAQKKGKTEWYLSYEVRVARVERAYSFKTEAE